MTEKIITDLARIAALAEQNWSDNWNFRAFLKLEVSPSTLDKVAFDITHKVSNAIDCIECGNCCREVYPHMTEKDIERLRSGLSKKQSALLNEIKQEGDRKVFCSSPCPLLEGDRCTAYQVRPDDCREYPHLDKPDFLGGSIGFIENYRVCPIVFNVWNQLKSSFHYDSKIDYIGDSDPEAD